MGQVQSDQDASLLNRCCAPGQAKPDVTTEAKADPTRIWTEAATKDAGPVIAIAVHHGHAVHPEAAAQMQITELNRLIEEDPYTGEWAFVGNFQAVATHSRFEVDLNRTRDKCVYVTPADSWNLKVWKDEVKGPSNDVKEKCLQYYDKFYAKLREVCEKCEREYGAFIVLDLHSYNHRRAGPTAKADDQSRNPEINVGTSNMDRKRWGPLVDRFMKEVSAAQTYSKSSVTDFAGGKADVRENVRFTGGAICRWIHTNFPRSGVALALEFKKFWMDEWTGVKDQLLVDELGKALAATIPGIKEELAKVAAANKAENGSATATAAAPSATTASATTTAAASTATAPAAAPSAGASTAAAAPSPASAPIVSVTASAPSAASIVITAPAASPSAADAKTPQPATVVAVIDAPAK